MNDERTLLGSPIRALAPLCISLLAVGLMVLPTLQGITSRWLKFDEAYSHGILLAAVTVFLSVRITRAYPVKAGFYPLWVFPLCACLIAYWIGSLIRLQALQHLALVPLLASVLGVLMGYRQLSRYFVPFALLFLTIPVWDFLAWSLQLITVAINKFLLGLLDIDFEVEGIFVYLIGVGTFEVAHGCSGLRYLLVGQALSLIYGELYLSRLRSKITVFCLGVAFALVANWIRVFVIIYMGYETNMQSGLIEDHDNFGWWVFAGTLVPLFFLARKIESKDDQYVVKQSPKAKVVNRGKAGVWPATGIVLALIAVAWVALPERKATVVSAPAVYDIDIGDRFGPIFGTSLEEWRPTFRNPDRIFTQTLFDRKHIEQDKGLAATYYLGVFTYDYQRHRAELIQYNNRLYDGNIWIPEQFFSVDTLANVPVKGITLKNRVTGARIHLAYSYYAQGQWETDQWRAKLAQVGGFITGRDDASLLVAALTCTECEAESALAGFVETVFPEVIERIDLQAGLAEH